MPKHTKTNDAPRRGGKGGSAPCFQLRFIKKTPVATLTKKHLLRPGSSARVMRKKALFTLIRFLEYNCEQIIRVAAKTAAYKKHTTLTVADIENSDKIVATALCGKPLDV